MSAGTDPSACRRTTLPCSLSRSCAVGRSLFSPSATNRNPWRSNTRRAP
ncbi:Uncharacterised protein [Bordetella pertussis]|nr:Uncharacterised protein [Bordetella pertussis]